MRSKQIGVCFVLWFAGQMRRSVRTGSIGCAAGQEHQQLNSGTATHASSASFRAQTGAYCVRATIPAALDLFQDKNLMSDGLGCAARSSWCVHSLQHGERAQATVLSCLCKKGRAWWHMNEGQFVQTCDDGSRGQVCKLERNFREACWSTWPAPHTQARKCTSSL